MDKDKKYYYGVGRRKASTTRSKYFPTNEALTISVDGKPLRESFKEYDCLVLENFVSSLGIQKGRFELFCRGGGTTGQIESARLAMAKSLLAFDEGHRPVLRSQGYLTTDIRKVLPKRPGRRKARKVEQWSKR